MFGQVENAGPGSRGVGNTASGRKHGYVENAGLGSRGVEKTGSGRKHGVWWKRRALSEKHGV